MFDALFNDWVTWLIPIFAAIIGWGTNVVAVKMMFYPINFVGFAQPYLGWQGIVPRHAKALAARSTEIITEKLINLKTVFESFDAEQFSGNLDTAMDELTEQVIAETATKYAPEMWAKMPKPVQQQVKTMLRGEIQQVSVKILAEMGEQIEEIIDLKAIVVETAHRDRALIGEMFQTVGAQEFKFIKNSGAYFGLLFGIIQLFAWLAYSAWWVLPFFGFFVGYATNWLAIKLIFEPKEPKKFGPFTVQGLFHKRQAGVAKEFATMVSSEILNTENMVKKMSTGEAGEQLFGIVDRHVGEMIDRYAANPMFASLVPAGEWGNIRTELKQRVREELPKEGGFLYIFVGKAIDVYGELFSRMTELDSESFEGILRPAFQQDEWKLIVAGAVLGLGAGVLQVLYLFGDQLRG